MAEQHLQGTAAALELPGSGQRCFDLRQNLILSQNHGLQSACQRKQVLHRLPVPAADQVRLIGGRVQPLESTQQLRQLQLPLGAEPKLRPVAGGQKDTAFHLLPPADRPHRRFRRRTGKREALPDPHRRQGVIHTNHLYVHVLSLTSSGIGFRCKWRRPHCCRPFARGPQCRELPPAQSAPWKPPR